MTSKKDYNRLRPVVITPPTNEQQIAHYMNDVERISAQIHELSDRIEEIMSTRVSDSFVFDDLMEECRQAEIKRTKHALQLTYAAERLVFHLKEQKKALN